MDAEQALMVPEANAALTLSRDPEREIEEATRAAKALQRVLDQRAEKVIRNGKRYLTFEDWSTCARFYGVSTRITRVEFVDYGTDGDGRTIRGFNAFAEAVHIPTGAIVAAAESSCLTDEDKWAKAPLFQVKSMAQTRAAAKALRMALAYVVVLAGYATTPAEEMDHANQNGESHGGGGQQSHPSSHSGDTRKVTQGQQKRLFAISRENHHTIADVKAWLKAVYNLDRTDDITREVYDDICARLADSTPLPTEPEPEPAQSIEGEVV